MEDYTKIREKVEQWKPIKGLEGLYSISSFGNIASLMFRNNICTKPKIKKIKPHDNGYGYLIVQLRGFDGERSSYYVHRLVAEAFVENPNGFPVVNHLDMNKQNNHACNLEWTTQKKNVEHSSHLMRKPKSRSKPSNTGEKYISIKKNRYCVFNRKHFRTLEEAIAYRNEVVERGENMFSLWEKRVD